MEPAFRQAALELCGFIAASVTPFHTVAASLHLLLDAGFQLLNEGESWELAPRGRYCLIRNDSSLAAWISGSEPVAQSGFRIIGAHTDTPGLRLKPRAGFERHGYLQLGVEVYGGAILASWADRDLGLAGRVVLDQGSSGTSSRLLLVDQPVARVPLVAVHLDREVNEKGLVLNRESQLPPVIGLAREGGPGFTDWLAARLGVGVEQILDHELMLFDLQAPAFGGLEEEFLFAPRLDNLACCHAALRSLLDSAASKVAATRVIVLYDNEEIGSSTRQGAAGSLLGDLLARVSAAQTPEPQADFRARARSDFLSADMAHAVHPNYADRHEERHRPRLNQGPVIKYNANARYATNAETAALFRKVCRRADVPCQEFVMRADLTCGSTIGPLVSTRLGLKTVDVGNPMLSMHSCREMAGALDPWYLIRAMSAFLAE